MTPDGTAVAPHDFARKGWRFWLCPHLRADHNYPGAFRLSDARIKDIETYAESCGILDRS